MLETSSIARGIEATDAMMKRASVDLLLTTIVPRGKYLVLIGGDVADVEAALRAGRDTRRAPWWTSSSSRTRTPSSRRPSRAR